MVYKISNNKAAEHVGSIGDVSGSENVTEMWKEYFEKLYSAKTDSEHQHLFKNKSLNCTMDINDLLFTSHDITVTVGKQKMHKAAGPDGIQMEAFIYGCHRLYVYLSVLFNIFAKHGCIPSDFCHAVLLPLVKSKNGNLADVKL